MKKEILSSSREKKKDPKKKKGFAKKGTQDGCQVIEVTSAT